ncbi:MAG: acyltransferase family protein [Hyphomicrobiaceae bacterium]
MIYRPDIDGLRAIAVVAVVLCHAGLPSFSGGYVGVDVFFVVSGFLITSIIKRDMIEARFSLGRFYERRARRILPALTLVTVVTVPFAWLLMFPHFFLNFAQSIVATLLFANNVLLASAGGYWDLEANLKPLLHTWSLGVEEQFYAVFPIVMIILWKLGRSWQLFAIMLIILASFMASEVGRLQYPSINFFLSTSRAWELLLGCLAAYIDMRPRKVDNALSFAGLAAIVASIVLFDHATPSPSPYNVLPVFGAAAILVFSRDGTVAYRLLSFPLCVGIGVISYSAYLWHQPIFALSRAASLDPPTPLLMVGLAVLSFGLALFSWKYVEQPCRNRHIVPFHTLAYIGGPLYILMIAFGLLVHANKGFPGYTFPKGGDDVQSYALYNTGVFEYKAEAFPHNGLANVLVVGNSVGRDATNVLIEGSVGRSRTNLVYWPIIPEELCRRKSELDQLAARANFILVPIAPGGSNIAGIRRGIDCVESISQAEVVIFGPKHFGANINPFANVPLGERAHALSKVRPGDIAYNSRLKAAFAGETYIDLLDLLGPDGKMVSVFDADGNPLTADRIHLTKYGAAFLAKRFVAAHPALASRLRLSP